MSIVTIDFETYYSKDFSLSKMTTEEYVNDPRFEVIGMGVKVDEGEAVWYSNPTDIERLINGTNWGDHAILCHNTLFDGAILAWKYGVKPGFWMDTLSMGRAIHGVEAGGSLKALASRYQIGEKGDEVIAALGKRRADFTADELARYGEYCRNDVQLTYDLFNILMEKYFPDDELQLIDLTLRMYTEPKLHVDDALLVERLEEVKKSKLELLSMLKGKLNCETEEDVRKKLCSNPKFAEVLRNWGVEPPTKISARTGKEAFAFSKTDQGFIALQSHEDPTIQQLCAVRLGTKSTLEESRIGRFIDIGSRNRGLLPVPLRYYGAHTGRWSGYDAVNFQNLPSRDKKKKALKNAILAPPGYRIVNCDSSQIEARVLAWLAGQNDVVEAFAQKRDIYCEDATKAFGRTITKKDEMERFVGKTMRLGLGYGTGATKLHSTLKLGGATISEDRCKDLVNSWRQHNNKITELWRKCDDALRDMMNWGPESKPYALGEHECLWVTKTGILLPNNLYIRYGNLRMHEGKAIYDSRKGPVNIWGGSVVENVVQALARIVIGEQMLAANAEYPVVLTVHDAIVCLVPEDSIDQGLARIVEIMSNPPRWGQSLPVACEAKHGPSYGDC